RRRVADARSQQMSDGRERSGIWIEHDDGVGWRRVDGSTRDERASVLQRNGRSADAALWCRTERCPRPNGLRQFGANAVRCSEDECGQHHTERDTVFQRSHAASCANPRHKSGGGDLRARTKDWDLWVIRAAQRAMDVPLWFSWSQLGCEGPDSSQCEVARTRLLLGGSFT